MQVRIVGLGMWSDEMVCILSGTKATGFIELNSEMQPCNLSILGPGQIGSMVEVPKEYHSKLKSFGN